MNDIEVSSIDLVEGGNVFKQGHYLTLGYVPRDEKGETVDLSGKTLNVSLWGRKGVVFESAATYSGGVIRFTFDKLVAAGDYTVEFTATSSTDAKYRKKFPTNQHSGRIAIKQSADDLGVVGIQVYTVAQLKAEQKALLDAAVSGFTVDSETKMARVSGSTTYTSLPARLEADKQATALQLADKAEYEETRMSLNAKRDLATKLVGADLADSVLQMIAGTAPVNATPAKASIDTTKYKAKSVIRQKTNFYQPATANLFDMSNIRSGGYYNPSTGIWIADASLTSSDFIEVEQGETYTATKIFGITYFDENYNYVTGVTGSINAPFTVPIGTGVKYLAMPFYPNTLNTTMLVKGSALPAYTPYKVKDVQLLISNDNLSSTFTGPADLTNLKNAFGKPVSTNLFNPANAVNGKYYDGLTGELKTDATLSSSELIPVTPEQTYIGTKTYSRAFFDANKVFVPKGTNGSSTSSFTAPIGTAYVSVSFLTSDLNTTMVVQGSSLPSYTPYREKYTISTDSFILEQSSSPLPTTSKWFGKKWAVLGDSITFGEATTKTYHSYIADEKKTSSVLNYGISSSSVGAGENGFQPMSERYLSMDNTADLITVFAGVNDNVRGVPLGTSSDTTNLTFYGALDVLFKGLVNKYPTKTIAVFTPLQHLYNAGTASSLITYVNAIKEVAQRYALPVLDLYSMSGLAPSVNVISTTYFDSIKLHPNAAGHRILANKMGAFLETL